VHTRIRSLLLIAWLIASMCCPAFAQQQSGAIGELKEQIQKMESIDRDPATPADVRNLNRNFLEARRAQLRELLIKSIAALRKYQSSFRSSLTSEENKEIENKIGDWEKTLQDLKETVAGDQTLSAGNDNSSSTIATKTGEKPLVGTVVTPGIPVADTDNKASPSLTSPAQPQTSPTPAPAAVVAGPSCYPDLPAKVGELADTVAALIIDKKPPLTPSNAIARHFEPLMYFTIADALFTEKDKVNLRKLHVQQFVAETARTDKQTGASARSPGSVSAIEKPGFSNLLGFAIDHGAVEKQVNGTTLTLSTSPYALIVAGNGGDTSANHKKYNFFNRIGASANFNIANQNDLLTNASRKQLEEWSVKVRLNSDYSSRSPDFQDFWDRDVKPLIEQRAVIYVSAFDRAFNNDLQSTYTKLKNEFQPLGGAKSPLDLYLEGHATLSDQDKKAGLRQEIICKLRAEVYDSIKDGTIPVSDALREDFNRTVKALVSAQLKVEEGKVQVENKIKELNEKPTATFAYSNMHPPTGSVFSVFRFLHERKAYDPIKLVANAGFSLYHNPNPKLNQQRIRDIAFALSFDGSAGRSPFVSASSELDQSKIVYSFTGRYQRLFENRQQANKKADIAVAQFKLEIPIFTGVSIPFSITFANATELIKEKHMRANFGFTLDTDKLFLLGKLKKE
jgi:hypothetical protein